MTPLVIELPLRLVSSLNAREHWAAKHRRAKEQRGTVYMALCAAGQQGRFARAHYRARVILTRIAPRALDVGDNLPASAKACRDGVADFLGIDDRSTRVEWVYRQERRGVGEYGVRVEVVELGESAA